jgi:SAM-dependent methyltransferase
MTDERTRRELWDERHAARDPIESHEPDPTLVATIAGLVPGRALDLAAGDGRNAIRLARDGWSVTAVDFSSVAIERARRSATTAGVDVDWVQADLLEWRPPRRAFELVALVYLHLPEPERGAVYSAAADAVAPGGRFLVIGHDRANLLEGSGGPQDPAVLFTADEVATDLAGFEIERAERVVSEDPGGRRAIDAVVLARRPAEA